MGTPLVLSGGSGMEMLEESLCLPLCKGMLQHIQYPVEEKAAPLPPTMPQEVVTPCHGDEPCWKSNGSVSAPISCMSLGPPQHQAAW